MLLPKLSFPATGFWSELGGWYKSGEVNLNKLKITLSKFEESYTH